MFVMIRDRRTKTGKVAPMFNKWLAFAYENLGPKGAPLLYLPGIRAEVEQTIAYLNFNTSTKQ